MSAPARARRRRMRLSVSVTEPTRAGTIKVSRGLGVWLQRAAPRSARGTVHIAIVSDRQMRVLNARFRQVDAPTDVLSFPAADAPAHAQRPATRAPRRSLAPEPSQSVAPTNSHEPSHLGDVAIAAGVARRQAATQGHALRTELRILALHGLLHLLGYDHEQDQGEMRAVEERLRRRLRLPIALIARASGPTIRR
ncbi:MAG: rRNA maturation RNase YbeY [Vicinamibacterales bacterium]